MSSTKQLVKVINTNTKVEFTGNDLKNAHFLNYVEKNPDEFESVYEEIVETKEGPVTLPKLMAKSVKELQKIASEHNISFGVPLAHLTKSEIANGIIESMKGK